MNENRSLVTIANLSKEKIMYLIQMAQVKYLTAR